MQDKKDEKCNEHSLDLKLFCEDCAKSICPECYIEHHVGHTFVKIADRAKASRNEATSIVNMINDRKALITKCVGALKQIDSQLCTDKIEEEIDTDLGRARQYLEENSKRLKDDAKRMILKNKDNINSKIRNYGMQLELLDELKSACSEVLGSSDAKILTCMPSFIEEARTMVQEETNTAFKYDIPNFTSLSKDTSQLVLGTIKSSACSVKLNDVNVDPAFINEDGHDSPPKKQTDKPIGMMDLFEELPTFPALPNPLDHFQYMYTYDSPTPEPATAPPLVYNKLIGGLLSSINGHEKVNSSNTSNPITWSQNFEINQTSSDPAGTSGGLKRPKTWSNLFDSGPKSPLHITSVPKSINYDSSSRNTTSPLSTSSGETASSDPINDYVDPTRVTATPVRNWERDGAGANIITVDVCSNGNVAVLDKESFSTYENGLNVFSNPRKYPPKYMAFVTIDKVEFVVEIHRDNILRFHTRDGYKLPQLPPTYDTRKATQLHICSAGNMLFLTYSGDWTIGEPDNDFVQVYECGRLPPTPYKTFNSGIKGIRSMCALDTPKGLMVVLACANHCVKKPEQADMVLLALDMNGKAMWQLNWNLFPAMQVIAGKVRYDLKDICTDGQVIYVVDKWNSTVYAVCREGRQSAPRHLHQHQWHNALGCQQADKRAHYSEFQWLIFSLQIKLLTIMLPFAFNQ